MYIEMHENIHKPINTQKSENFEFQNETWLKIKYLEECIPKSEVTNLHLHAQML